MASPRVGMVYGLDTIEGVIDFTFCMEVLVIVYCFHFVEWGGGSLFPQLTHYMLLKFQSVRATYYCAVILVLHKSYLILFDRSGYLFS